MQDSEHLAECVAWECALHVLKGLIYPSFQHHLPDVRFHRGLVLCHVLEIVLVMSDYVSAASKASREITGDNVSLANNVGCIQNKSHRASGAVRTKQISVWVSHFYLLVVAPQKLLFSQRQNTSASCIKFCFNEFRNVEH